jgi:hypothetical protein
MTQPSTPAVMTQLCHYVMTYCSSFVGAAGDSCMTQLFRCRWLVSTDAVGQGSHVAGTVGSWLYLLLSLVSHDSIPMTLITGGSWLSCVIVTDGSWQRCRCYQLVMINTALSPLGHDSTPLAPWVMTQLCRCQRWFTTQSCHSHRWVMDMGDKKRKQINSRII